MGGMPALGKPQQGSGLSPGICGWRAKWESQREIPRLPKSQTHARTELSKAVRERPGSRGPSQTWRYACQRYSGIAGGAGQVPASAAMSSTEAPRSYGQCALGWNVLGTWRLYELGTGQMCSVLETVVVMIHLPLL